MRLLLVDDSPEIRKQLPRLLGGVPGVREVSVAADGDAGLYLAQQRSPEVMIVDLELRRSSLNGIELVSQLARREEIPTLMVYTNHPELREYALQAGADYFFDKGTETGRLLKTVRQIAPNPRPSQKL